MMSVLLTLLGAGLFYLCHPQQAFLNSPLHPAWRLAALAATVAGLALAVSQQGAVAGPVAWLVALMLGLVLSPLLGVHARGLATARGARR
jgi:FtsH-binding integral membrane protein